MKGVELGLKDEKMKYLQAELAVITLPPCDLIATSGGDRPAEGDIPDGGNWIDP